MQTVGDLGPEILLEPLLSEAGYLHHEPSALTRLQAILIAGGTPVLCSQGGVIPDLLSRLAKESGLPLPHTRTPKGSTWLLSFSPDPTPQLLAADHIPAP